MLYALSNLTDKKRPSARAIDAAEDALSGEVVVESLPVDAVWDASARKLRALTKDEKKEAQDIMNSATAQRQQDLQTVKIAAAKDPHVAALARLVGIDLS